MSIKCEKLIDELTVQVWLLYHHPSFKYCTLQAGRKYGQTDGQTDGHTIQLLDAPGRLFRPGGIKSKNNLWTPSPTHQTCTLDPTSDKSQGVVQTMPLLPMLEKEARAQFYRDKYIWRNAARDRVLLNHFNNSGVTYRGLEFFLKFTCQGQVKTENSLSHPRNLLSR